MKYFAISLFPESIDFYTNQSILGRAQKNKIITQCPYMCNAFIGGTNCWARCKYFKGFEKENKSVKCSYTDNKKT